MPSFAPSFGRFSLKLALVFAGTALLPLVVVSVRLPAVNREALTSLARDHQYAVARDVEQTVRRAVEQAEKDLHAVSVALLDAASDGDASVRAASAVLATSQALDYVAIYDAAGARIDTLRVDGRPLRVVSDTMTPCASPLSFFQGASEPEMSLCVPLMANGVVTGQLTTTVSLASLTKALEQVFAAVLGRRGDRLAILSATGDAIIAVGEPTTTTIPTDKSDSAERYADYGERDVDGRRVVATRVSLPHYGISLYVEQPSETVYQSIDDMQGVVRKTGVFVTVFALVLAFFASRRLTKPLAELVEFAKELGRRRFVRRTLTKTSDELSVVGEAMNDAAEALHDSEVRLRQEQELRTNLSRYLPQPLVEELASQPSLTSSTALASRKGELTVLFADIVGFSRMQNELGPEKTVALLNELFSLLTAVVFRHGGTVDKFLGDAIMAFWGAPDATVPHAERAVLAARDMRRLVSSCRPRFLRKYGREVHIAIGVATGEAVVGNVGSHSRFEYTAIGDAVNVASRLEEIAQPLQVLLTDATHAALTRVTAEHVGHHHLGLSFVQEPRAAMVAGVSVWSLID